MFFNIQVDIIENKKNKKIIKNNKVKYCSLIIRFFDRFKRYI
jgi:hypothetical protein